MTWSTWLAVLGGALGAFMAILDIQVTNASLREISGALSLDISESGWISSAYLIAEIIVIPLTAILSSIVGLRRYMLLNCAGFLVASTLCGISWNSESLIFFRTLQGLTGGTLIPLSFQIILKLMPQSKKTLGITIFGLTVTLAPTLGPTLGGYLTDNEGWRSIFFINLLPGTLMIWMLWKGLKATESRMQDLRLIDIPSLITLVIGLSTLTYLLEEGPKQDWFESGWIRIHFCLCLMTLPFFILRQFEISNPLLKLTLLRERNFALGTVITTLAGCALFSGIYSLSLFLGQVKDMTAAQIGQILMWIGLPQLLVMPFAPFLMRKVDLRVLALMGLGLFAYSNWMNSHLSISSSGDDFVNSLLLRALGQPLFVIPLSVMAMGLIQHEDSGDASAIFNVMRNLGASIGIALTSTFLIRRQSFHLLAKGESYSAFDFGLMEKFYKSDTYYKRHGLDAMASAQQAFHDLTTPIVNDSVISTFNDIYLILTIALVACLFLILGMRKTKASGAGPAAH